MTEYFEGITLTEIVRNDDESAMNRYIGLLEPVIDCMGLMHRRGIVHRDICPDNILVSANFKTRIIDFGSAVNLNKNNSAAISEPTYRKGFSPLEQYGTGHDFGAWSDVYSLSAAIYYCVTKLIPPDAVERQTSASFARYNLSDGNLWNLIEKGMALDRKERWQTTDDVLREFYKLRKQVNA